MTWLTDDGEIDMSCESALTIYRIHLKEIADETFVQKIKNQYLEYYPEVDRAKYSTNPDFWPYVLDSMHMFDSPKRLKDRFYTINGEECDLIIQENFCSNFSELWDEYHLTPYGIPGKACKSISVNDAKDILQAVRYLYS